MPELEQLLKSIGLLPLAWWLALACGTLAIIFGLLYIIHSDDHRGQWDD